VVGFFDSWPADRKFPVDMAGFAVSVELLLQNPNASMPYKAGHEEDQFLKSLGLKMEEIEPKANNCTEVDKLLEI
jgi:beta-1,3-glucuronyltransferase S